MPLRAAAIDAVGISVGGGGQVAFDCAKSCLDHSGVDRLHVFVSSKELADDLSTLADDRLFIHPRSQTWAFRLWWWLFGVDREVKRRELSAVLHLANVALRKKRKYASAVLVHQLNVLDSDGSVDRRMLLNFRYSVLRRLVRRSVDVSDVTLVQTEAVARRVSSLSKRANVQVAFPSVPRFEPLRDSERGGEPGHEYLYIGSDAPHKNVSLLERSAHLLATESPDSTFVVTVEGKGSPYPPSGIKYVGRLTRAEVRLALGRARALVMPSLAETVGLPQLEAMSLGVPVLAADRPYAHAICGSAARYFDPEDPRSLVDACLSVQDPQVWLMMSEAGRKRVSNLADRDGGIVMARFLERASRGQ